MVLTRQVDNWVTVPTNSTITIHKQTVMIHPIIDEYYNYSPAYERSSGFAVSKGLVSNAPGGKEGEVEAREGRGGREERGGREMEKELRVVTEGGGGVEVEGGEGDEESESE